MAVAEFEDMELAINKLSEAEWRNMKNQLADQFGQKIDGAFMNSMLGAQMPPPPSMFGPPAKTATQATLIQQQAYIQSQIQQITTQSGAEITARFANMQEEMRREAELMKNASWVAKIVSLLNGGS